MVTAGVGIAVLAIGIFGAYLIYQKSTEDDYVKETNKLLSIRNQTVNEFISDLLPKMATKQFSIIETKFRVSSLVNDDDLLSAQTLKLAQLL